MPAVTPPAEVQISAIVHKHWIDQNRHVGVLCAQQLTGAPVGDRAGPCSRPAAARMKVPVQTEQTRLAFGAAKRNQSTSAASVAATMHAGAATDDEGVDIFVVAIGEG